MINNNPQNLIRCIVWLGINLMKLGQSSCIDIKICTTPLVHRWLVQFHLQELVAVLTSIGVCPMVIGHVETQNEATAATIVAFGVMAMEKNAVEQYTLSNIVTIVQYHNYLQVEVLLIC